MINPTIIKVTFFIYLTASIFTFLIGEEEGYFGGWPTNERKDQIQDPGFLFDCEADSDKKNTVFCVEKFINGFSIYQTKLYENYLQKLNVANELQIKNYDFIDYYGEKYNLMNYWNEQLISWLLE